MREDATDVSIGVESELLDDGGRKAERKEGEADRWRMRRTAEYAIYREVRITAPVDEL